MFFLNVHKEEAILKISSKYRKISAAMIIMLVLSVLNMCELKTSAGEKEDPPIPVLNSRTMIKGMVLKEIPLKEKITIIDKVFYENLKPDTAYTLHGILMVKNSDGVYEKYKKGNDMIEASCSFRTSDNKNGYEEYGEEWIEFEEIEISDVEGKTFAVYENLYLGTDTDAVNQYEEYPDKKIFPIEHKNEEDKQLIRAAYINSSIKGLDNESKELKINQAGKTVITDTISYENLTPDMSYRIVGKLVDSKTGKRLADDYASGDEEKVFVARKASGCVEVSYEIKTEDSISISIEESLFNAEGSLIARNNSEKDGNNIIHLIKETKQEITEEKKKEEISEKKDIETKEDEPEKHFWDYLIKKINVFLLEKGKQK